MSFDINRGKLPTQWIVLAIIAFIVLSKIFIIVPSGTYGLVSTFGKVSPNIKPEGLNIVIPFVQELELYSVRTQKATFKTMAYSSDLQMLNIDIKVLYNQPKEQLYTIRTKYRGNIERDFLEPRVLDAIKDVASKYKAEEFVKSRQDARPQILELIKENIQGIIRVSDLSITNIDLSDELERAIERKQVEEQKALQKKYELAKERIDAEIKVVKATADAKAIRIKANAISSNPKIIELEAVKKWNGQMPATYVSGGGTSTFLPLK